MSFGPTRPQGYFRYFIHGKLLGRIGKGTEAYLAQIMVYTKKGVDYKQVLGEILKILRKQNLWQKPEKLSIGLEWT